MAGSSRISVAGLALTLVGLAVGLAGAAVFAWLEVGRQAALAALVADAEGLIQPPPLLQAEPVIEALPADE